MTCGLKGAEGVHRAGLPQRVSSGATGLILPWLLSVGLLLVGLLSVGLLSVGLLLGCGKTGAPEDSRRPTTVILVSIDSLRADHLGAYGYDRPTSPVIDRLAEGGALFERVTASSSWTLPSHAALFTGMADSIHGVVDKTWSLGPVLPTLAEVFRQEGFATGAVVSGPYLHPGFGLDRGFDDYLNCMGFLDEEFGVPEGEPVRLAEMTEASHSDVTSPCVVRRAKEWLRAHSGEPTFLFLHFWDVHYDYLPPPPFDNAFDPDYRGSLDATDFEHNPALHAEMPARDLEHLVALYDGEIAYVDRMIGELLGFLEERELTDELLLAVTSDHGEAFFEHGRKGHRGDLHVEQVRVPLVFWGQGVPEGRRLDAPAHLVDVMPTLLDLSTDAVTGSLGRGRGRTILGPEANLSRDRWVVSELYSGNLDLLAIETRDRKVILDRARETLRAYDLTTDPGEHDPREPTGSELRELARTVDALGEASPEGAALPIGGAPPELRERLRALGYLD